MISNRDVKGRILLAKTGLDGHNRGILIIARALKDAGFEVIYTGIRQTAEQVIETALQEDVDCIGLSCLSGAHLTHFLKVAQLAKEKGLGELPLFCGGIIPAKDDKTLKKAGYKDIFRPGTRLETIIEEFKRACGKNE